MNPALRRTGIIALVLLGAIFLQLNKVQFFDARELSNSDHNARVLIEEYEVPRGQIQAADGTVLAESLEADPDRQLKYYRNYPEGSYFGNLTGYKSIVYGTSGLESTENEVLNGTGSLFFTEQVKDTFTGEAVLGGNVVTGLDVPLQQQAYDAVSDTGVDGAAVVLNPQTGEILAEVSVPGFDPTPISSNDRDTSAAAWEEVTADGEEGSTNSRLFDQSRQGVFPPGSTFKTVTAAAFIKNGHGNADTMVPAGNSYEPPDTDHTITNEADQCPEEELSLKEAFARSCNTTFARLCVDTLSAKEMNDMAADFGMGEAFQTPLESATSEIGDVSAPAFRAQSCFGQQDVRMSPLQNSVIAATIANDGARMDPMLVTEISDQESGATLQEFQPQRADDILTTGQAHEMKILMREVVNGPNGTGSNARQPGYTIAGKTGTAENTDAEGTDRPSHGWFIGWGQGDSNAPAVAVCVFLQNYGDGGSGEATRIGGQLMSTVLDG
ncbi:penicillin-binding transpeptidase domain-containing protein [Haloglycomyces albus]|uniref:penicillin-binding transpeptidase domain-containing protein n=1 Tax=Haloglycomyces albus TaxID=526067 RepID=UPI00046CDE4C|nr:penicillin-binding transpeptidase domain-containing protein [Haloglycomyces albus]